jgi:formate dehydrogenase maturation protein FdhE
MNAAMRRSRAEALRSSHPFSAELMTLYLALLPVQEDAFEKARARAPAPDELARWAAETVLPAVVDATVRAGPPALAEAVSDRLDAGHAERALAGWLAGAELDPVDRYLARATLAPVLEALGERVGAACAAERPGEAGERCPRCGGLPQLSVIASSGDQLVSGARSLLCSRCGGEWKFSRSTCAACGERREERLSVYAEELSGAVSGPGANGNGNGDARPPRFPQLRVAGCSTCGHYLIEVDMARDVRAVPEVDELAALPLDLHAADEGLVKVTPNLMGF